MSKHAKNALFAGAVAVTIIGVGALYIYNEKIKARSEIDNNNNRISQEEQEAAEDEHDIRLREKVKRISEQQLENIMILYKRDHPNCTFTDFMVENFPENITRKGDEIILDSRVLTPDWQGRFSQVHGSQPLHECELLPIC
eukprot:c13152_g1_i1.p1 GENE.c13152_g1_i1~~c13152_g1_i1.p1  ORF type:complete len:152 (+),score=64.61 c13152_g1_i1:35-457(+)